MVAAWTWAKRPSMTQPRNRRAAEGGRGRSRAVRDATRLPPVTARDRPLPPFGFVAASIPRANRNLPQPASRRGDPRGSDEARDGAHHARDPRPRERPQPGTREPPHPAPAGNPLPGGLNP